MFTFESFESKGETTTLSAELEEVNVHLRGGNIVPTQVGGLTTVEVQASDFNIIVALCGIEENCAATGELYVDDGESVEVSEFLHIKYAATTKSFSSKVNEASYSSKKTIASVKVLGVNYDSISKVTVNGASWDKFQQNGEVLTVFLDGVLVSDPLTITYDE